MSDPKADGYHSKSEMRRIEAMKKKEKPVSFIQCRDSDEAEKTMNDLKAGFVSEDHRIYQEIEFWDDCSVWYIPAPTLLALHNLQTQIEQMKDGFLETSFDEIVDHAKELQDAFQKAVKAVGFKPIRKSKR